MDVRYNNNHNQKVGHHLPEHCVNTSTAAKSKQSYVSSGVAVAIYDAFRSGPFNGNIFHKHMWTNRGQPFATFHKLFGKNTMEVGQATHQL